MSLSFSLRGPAIRPFLNLLNSLCRVGDAVHLLATPQGIEMSAADTNCTSHFAVSIRHCSFETFHLLREADAHDGAQRTSSDVVVPTASAATTLHRPPTADLCISMLTKALAATILRQQNNSTNALMEIRFHYSKIALESSPAATAAVAEDAEKGEAMDADDADTVSWQFLFARDIMKTYRLHLVDGYPSSVWADPLLYRFEASADARVFGNLAASLPSKATECSLVFLDGSMALRSANQAPPPFKAARRDSIRASDQPPPDTQASAAVVTAFAKSFLSMRYFAATAGHDVPVGAEGPLPSSRDIGSSTAVPFISLPGKLFDVRPFRRAALMAEQLGVPLKLLSGVEGAPLLLKSDTAAEPATEAEATDTRRQTLQLGRSTLPSLGLPTSHGHAAAAAESTHFSGSFSVHIAALDIPTPSQSVSNDEATDITTAANSAAHSPRHSTADAPPGRPSGSEELNAVRRSRCLSDTQVHACQTPSYSHVEATPSSAHDSVAATSGDVLVNGTCPSLDAARASGTFSASGLEAVQPTASQLSAAVVMSDPRHRSSGFAPPPPLHPSPSYVEASFPGSYSPCPPSTASAETVVVLTNGGGVGGTEVNSSVASARNSTTALRPPPSLSSPSTAAVLHSLYPLDFEAFVSSYAAQDSSVDDRAGSLGREEEVGEDIELREFLANCMATTSGSRETPT